MDSRSRGDRPGDLHAGAQPVLDAGSSAATKSLAAVAADDEGYRAMQDAIMPPDDEDDDSPVGRVGWEKPQDAHRRAPLMAAAGIGRGGAGGGGEGLMRSSFGKSSSDGTERLRGMAGFGARGRGDRRGTWASKFTASSSDVPCVIPSVPRTFVGQVCRVASTVQEEAIPVCLQLVASALVSRGVEAVVRPGVASMTIAAALGHGHVRVVLQVYKSTDGTELFVELRREQGDRALFQAISDMVQSFVSESKSESGGFGRVVSAPEIGSPVLGSSLATQLPSLPALAFDAQDSPKRSSGAASGSGAMASAESLAPLASMLQSPYATVCESAAHTACSYAQNAGWAAPAVAAGVLAEAVRCAMREITSVAERKARLARAGPPPPRSAMDSDDEDGEEVVGFGADTSALLVSLFTATRSIISNASTVAIDALASESPSPASSGASLLAALVASLTSIVTPTPQMAVPEEAALRRAAMALLAELAKADVDGRVKEVSGEGADAKEVARAAHDCLSGPCMDLRAALHAATALQLLFGQPEVAQAVRDAARETASSSKSSLTIDPASLSSSGAPWVTY